MVPGKKHHTIVFLLTTVYCHLRANLKGVSTSNIIVKYGVSEETPNHIQQESSRSSQPTKNKSKFQYLDLRLGTPFDYSGKAMKRDKPATSHHTVPTQREHQVIPLTWALKMSSDYPGLTPRHVVHDHHQKAKKNLAKKKKAWNKQHEKRLMSSSVKRCVWKQPLYDAKSLLP